MEYGLRNERMHTEPNLSPRKLLHRRHELSAVQNKGYKANPFSSLGATMNHVRVGITGLSRAGKTVFLTSTLYYLLETTGAQLPIFFQRKIRFAGLEHSIDGNSEPFPYQANLERYRNEKPEWPTRTAGVSEFSVDLMPNRGDRKMNPVRLSFVDYPGEKLHDLPLANQSFGIWSATSLRGLNSLPHCDAKCDFEKTLASVPTLMDGAGDGDAAGRIGAAYQNLCIAAREKGTVLPPVEVPAGIDSAAPLLFFPLPAAMQKSHPMLWQATEKKYDAYVAQTVKPFLCKVSECNHQIVLVDILGILRRLDANEYNRVKRSIREVLRLFQYGDYGEYPWLGPLNAAAKWALAWFQTGIQRVTFVCTKADQAAAGSRRNLEELLKQLVEQAATDIGYHLGPLSGRISYYSCAAHRSTDDRTTEFEGQKLFILKGRLKEGEHDSEKKVFPGEVPAKWPTTPKWEGFRFPDFAPRPLPAIDGAPLDQINLDKILFELIG
jgi:predicted YcjX-like family ATPase